MERKYWEKMAPDYDEEIFDVLQNDREQIISGALQHVAGKGKTVADLGCAIGKWLPLLSTRFGKVLAVDISKKNLDIAAKKHSHLANIDYHRADLSGRDLRLPKADVAICVNAILSTSRLKRDRFFENIKQTLRPGGSLLLVVPALESWMQTRVLQARYKLDRKLFRKPADEVAAERYHALQEGNAEIDDVLTKHYMEGELLVLLKEYGFSCNTPQKIRYTWDTEFVEKTDKLDAVAPWDWFVLARVIKN